VQWKPFLRVISANEEEVGKALKESGIPRSELFITTKLGWVFLRFARAICLSTTMVVTAIITECMRPLTNHFKPLDQNTSTCILYIGPRPLSMVGALVLLLRLFARCSLVWSNAREGKTLSPSESPTLAETWKEMETLLESGKVKAIGISNFGIPLVERLLETAQVVPVTNQVELHPCLPYEELKTYCESKGILLTAYSPLGMLDTCGLHEKLIVDVGRPPAGQKSATLLSHPDIVEIAERIKVQPGQVALSWGVQRGTIVVPKSESPERMKTNISVSACLYLLYLYANDCRCQLVKLSAEDMKTIDGIHKKPGMHKSLLAYHKDDGKVFGWTYDQLGWNMTKGGSVPQ
jgi:glycerol 2-dehydrogenase (NADP+)